MTRRILSLWALALCLAGCAGGPAVPPWKAEAASELDAYRRAALAGAAPAAKAAYRHTLAAHKQGGDFAGLVTVSLTRCAIERVTDGKPEGCAEYTALRQLADRPALDAYARWLDGGLAADDVKQLPEAYRQVAAAWLEHRDAALADALNRVEPPLSFLVALAVVGDRLPKPMPLWQKCESLASHQGWLAAHRACLQREAAWLDKRGDGGGAVLARRKMEVLAP